MERINEPIYLIELLIEVNKIKLIRLYNNNNYLNNLEAKASKKFVTK